MFVIDNPCSSGPSAPFYHLTIPVVSKFKFLSRVVYLPIKMIFRAFLKHWRCFHVSQKWPEYWCRAALKATPCLFFLVEIFNQTEPQKNIIPQYDRDVIPYFFLERKRQWARLLSVRWHQKKFLRNNHSAKFYSFFCKSFWDAANYFDVLVVICSLKNKRRSVLSHFVTIVARCDNFRSQLITKLSHFVKTIVSFCDKKTVSICNNRRTL